MKHRLWTLVILSGLGLTVAVVARLSGREVVQDEELALAPGDLLANTVAPYFPETGLCRPVLVFLKACAGTDDAGVGLPCAHHYALCSLPNDAGEDAGEVVLGPVEPEPTRVEKFQTYIHGKCAKAAMNVCIDVDRPKQCVLESTDKCELGAGSAGQVVWTGQDYPVTTETKAITALTNRQAQVRGGCACAPDPIKLGDSGLLPCLEWRDWTDGRDGGQWVKATPGRVLTRYLRPLCEPTPCEESAARESEPDCVAVLGAGCSLPWICRPYLAAGEDVGQ